MRSPIFTWRGGMRGKPRGDALEIGAAFRFDPADGDAFAGILHAGAVLEQAARLSRTGCARDVNDQPRATAELAKELLGLGRSIHLGRLRGGRRLRAGARRRSGRPTRCDRERALRSGLPFSATRCSSRRGSSTLFTPQLFVAAILLNGPIALSSLALRSRLTTQLVSRRRSPMSSPDTSTACKRAIIGMAIAVGDRLLSAASFVLVGYMSIKTQEYAREAGESSGRMRQIEIEKALREATRRVRETLNVELVQRGVVRESVSLLGRFAALLIVRDSAFELPLVLRIRRGGAADVQYERKPLSTELASLAARARESDGRHPGNRDDALGRLTLDSARCARGIGHDGSLDGGGRTTCSSRRPAEGASSHGDAVSGDASVCRTSRHRARTGASLHAARRAESTRSREQKDELRASRRRHSRHRVCARSRSADAARGRRR